MNHAQKLIVAKFDDPANPLNEFEDSGQALYLRRYLTDLEAASVVVEPGYFDRDYLSEFSAFYGTSARGYSNLCRRVHFFATPLTRRTLTAALGGSKAVVKRLQRAYLGFVVLRPIEAAPLGRTVLAWYPEHSPGTPRVTDPSRKYEVHLAGIPLTVEGVAWQQQDSCVAACATVALWSILHSSAFDDGHAIPTTASITSAAHHTASLGSRVFPSNGLLLEQIHEAIKENGLAPLATAGGVTIPGNSLRAFNREGFSNIAASFIRSGYPAILTGILYRADKTAPDGRGPELGKHAVCLLGFREVAPAIAPVSMGLQDGAVRYFYVHDDNIGPNVRFEIYDGTPLTPGGVAPALLKPSTPTTPIVHTVPDPTADRFVFMPATLTAAVHDDVRVTPETLLRIGRGLAAGLPAALKILVQANAMKPFGFAVSAKVLKAHIYLGAELPRTLNGNTRALARARMAIAEEVPPMSLHVGVFRVGRGAIPLFDVLYDTTDNARTPRPFCHVVYDSFAADLIDVISLLTGSSLTPWGTRVLAY